MRIGATYSHREIEHLGLDEAAAWAEVLDMGLSVIRLAAYWDEIEPAEGKFVIGRLKEMVEDCQKRHQQVVVVIGMKAPRWPEYYVPRWLSIKDPSEAEKQVVLFIERVVEALKGYACIEAWQVENEPLDKSGPDGWAIPLALLTKEVAAVRQLDSSRPIHLTAWGNSLSSRGFIPDLARLADVVGIDVYYRTPITLPGWLAKLGWKKPLYGGPADSDRRLRQIIKDCPKPVWISELQAEAWEHQDATKWQAQPPSMNRELLQQNMERARGLGAKAIVLWGIEYWYWQKDKGRMEWWEAGMEEVGRGKREEE